MPLISLIPLMPLMPLIPPLSLRPLMPLMSLIPLISPKKKAPRHISCARALTLIGGGYLLSHFRSTIGAAGFNFSVRNGKRWNPRAINRLSLFCSIDWC